MKRGFYFYRQHFIKRTSTGWTDYDEFPMKEYNTLDQVKNAVDAYLGGWSGRCEPQRHFK